VSCHGSHSPAGTEAGTRDFVVNRGSLASIRLTPAHALEGGDVISCGEILPSDHPGACRPHYRHDRGLAVEQKVHSAAEATDVDLLWCECGYIQKKTRVGNDLLGIR
jgi:hypothetical protein